MNMFIKSENYSLTTCTESHHGSYHRLRLPNGTILRRPYLYTALARKIPPSCRMPLWWPVASIEGGSHLKDIKNSMVSAMTKIILQFLVTIIYC